MPRRLVNREPGRIGGNLEQNAAGFSVVDRMEVRAVDDRRHVVTARNVVLVARLLTIAALARKESRGGHFRADFPDPSPHEARRRHFQLLPSGRVEAVSSFEPFQLPTAETRAAGAA
jgi:aspartate oxidase